MQTIIVYLKNEEQITSFIQVNNESTTLKDIKIGNLYVDGKSALGLELPEVNKGIEVSIYSDDKVELLLYLNELKQHHILYKMKEEERIPYAIYSNVSK